MPWDVQVHRRSWRRVNCRKERKKKLPNRSMPLPRFSVDVSAGAHGNTNNRERSTSESPTCREVAQSHVQEKGRSRRAKVQPPRNLFRPGDLVIPTSFPLHPPLLVDVQRGADFLGWESARGEFGCRFREFSSGCGPREGGKEGVREGLFRGLCVCVCVSSQSLSELGEIR